MAQAWTMPATARAARDGRGVALRRIGLADLGEVLRRGWADFMATPTQLVFLTIIYPVLGVLLATAAAGRDLWPMLWPLVGGFALLGPVAALGLYELSRRRERGETPSMLDAFAVLRSPAIGPIAVLGVVLLALFVAWIAAARAIWAGTMGHLPAPHSPGELLSLVASTPEGWRLALIGNGVGALFALVALALTVVSFPMLLDRGGGLGTAMRTSLRAVRANPVPMLAWGVIVAVLLFLGSLPVFVGLAIVLPVLGHATWHLYRRVVEVPEAGGG